MKRRVAMLLLLPALAAGCAPQQTHDTRATTDDYFNAVWDASVDVLGQYRFELDRADRRHGVITTMPLVGRHWFEFWRHDAVRPYDVAEGALQTIQRQAVVTVHSVRAAGQSGEGAASQPAVAVAPKLPPGARLIGDYYVTVEVRTGRSDDPHPLVTSTSEAYDLFAGTIRPPTEVEEGVQPEREVTYIGQLRDRASQYLVDLGRDGELERILQQRIYMGATKKLSQRP